MLAMLGSLAMKAAPFAIDYAKKKWGTKEGEWMSQDEMIPDWQRTARTTMDKWYSSNLNKYNPGEQYSGKYAAPMSSGENQAMSRFQQMFNSSNTGNLFGLAKKELEKTLTGGYDPASSPYYTSMKDAGKRNLTESIDTTRARRGARGTFYTKEGIQEEGDITSKFNENLNTILGSLSETERQRMFSAVPQAASLDQYENMTIPMTTAQNLGQAGAVQRMIQQTELEEKYNEFVRGRGELSEIPSQYSNFASNTSTPYGIKDWQGPDTLNTIGKIIEGLSPSMKKGLDTWSNTLGR